jgi:long-chain-fatty-acid---luciferin-component ligase
MSVSRSIISHLPLVGLLNGGFTLISGGSKLVGNPVWELCTSPKLWNMDQEKLREKQFRAIKYAFKYHYKNNQVYKDYCTKNGGFEPSMLKTFDDLYRIPQIPVEAFKKGSMATMPENKVKTVVTTSGTSGSVSYLPKDNKSLLRIGSGIINFMINVGAPRILKEQPVFEGKLSKLVNYALSNIYFSVMLPSPEEASTWFSSAFHGLTPYLNMLRIPYDFHLNGFKFDPEKILNTIEERRKENKMVFNIGFHYVLNELMNYMDAKGITYDWDPDGSRVCVPVIAGGWKKLSGEAIDKEAFKRKIVEHFGVHEPYIVDIYGFGESNTFALDFCTERNMHLGPWVVAFNRDPETLEPLEPGEKGLMSVLDPTTLSYPAFVMSDDITRVSAPFECDCGLQTQTVQYVGRAPKAELRSCGLKMQQIIEGSDKSKLEALQTKTLRTGVGI